MKYIAIVLSLLAWQSVRAQDFFTRFINTDTALYTRYVYGVVDNILTTRDGGHLLQYAVLDAGSDGPEYERFRLIKTDGAFLPLWQIEHLPVVAMQKGLPVVSCDYYDTGCLLQKLDVNGNPIWSKTFNTGNDRMALYHGVADGANIRLAGHIYKYGAVGIPVRPPVILTVDSNGGLLTCDTLAGDTTRITNMDRDATGHTYIVEDARYFHMNRKITRLTATNTVLWSRILQFSGYSYNLTSILVLPDASVILAGSFRAMDFEHIFVMRLSSSGDIMWQKASHNAGRVENISLRDDGLISLFSGGLGVYAQGLPTADNIITMDDEGNTIITRNLDVDRVNWPWFRGVSTPYITPSGDWYIAAVAALPYAPMIIHTDEYGTGLCSSAVVPMQFYDSVMFSTVPSTIHLGHLPLSTLDVVAPPQVLPVTFGDGCSYYSPLAVEDVKADRAGCILPNPNSGDFSIRLDPSELPADVTVTDVSGRVVSKMRVIESNTAISSHLRPGLYILSAQSAKSREVYKMQVVE